MKERPILFRTEMVKAILAGHKTQIRQVIKPQPKKSIRWIEHDVGAKFGLFCSQLNGPALIDGFITCPYGQPGDRLYVKETWRATGTKYQPYAYLADEGDITLVGESGDILVFRYRYQPSVNMPRKASRITLEVTDVQVKNLHDLTEADVIAEGITPEIERSLKHRFEVVGNMPKLDYFSLLETYSGYWDSINKKSGFNFNSNPWVWVVKFKKVEND